jgi:hypothetical protein
LGLLLDVLAALKSIIEEESSGVARLRFLKIVIVERMVGAIAIQLSLDEQSVVVAGRSSSQLPRGIGMDPTTVLTSLAKSLAERPNEKRILKRP